jgi:hypothetical protein
VLCLEEVELEIPVGRDTQVPLTDGDEDGCLCDEVGVEVVELHLIPGGSGRRNRLIGIPSPRSWNATKLKT